MLIYLYSFGPIASKSLSLFRYASLILETVEDILAFPPTPKVNRDYVALEKKLQYQFFLANRPVKLTTLTHIECLSH